MAPGLITGAVLAGGRSRRLGRDKATFPIAGRPLAHLVRDAMSSLVDECWLVSNQPVVHLELGIPLVIDLLPGRGALGGLFSVMLIAQGDYVLLSACDTPFVQPELLTAMLETCKRGQDAVICRSSRGLEPLPGVFSCRLFQRLQAQVIQGEDLRLRTLLNACRTSILCPEEIGIKDADDRTFFNINTPEDAAQAAALAVLEAETILI